MPNDTLTAIEGIHVGHAVLEGAMSGCTAIIPLRGAVAGVDVRGGAPGTYGTDTLNPVNLVSEIHGLFLTGGSAFGLNVAEGMRHFLTERNMGFDSGYGMIPIITGAVIFDLPMNPTGRYPNAELGYRACLNASDAPVEEGCAGAGLGASVGKMHGFDRSMKSGLGSACIVTESGVKVAALMVVNAFGNIYDPVLGRPVAGCRKAPDSPELVDFDSEILKIERFVGFPGGLENTVIGVVATNVKLNKTQLTKVAQMAHDGLARTISPVHTLYDGDTIFALSCGESTGAELSIVGALAAAATARAVLRGVRKARGPAGPPGHADLCESSR